jgi:hypothetical protein
MFTLSFHTLKPSESLTRIQKTACAPAPEPLWQIAALAIVEQEPLWQIAAVAIVEKKNNVCERANHGVSRNHYGKTVLRSTHFPSNLVLFQPPAFSWYRSNLGTVTNLGTWIGLLIGTF